jgi:hypothetical protein
LSTAEPNDRTEVQSVGGAFTKKVHIAAMADKANTKDLPAGI